MKCPIDDTVLQMTDRQGIEIDYCPQCRGVWLDRGELDKVIERSVDAPPPAPVRRDAPAPSYQPRGYDSHKDSGYYKKRKKESFLGELFDF